MAKKKKNTPKKRKPRVHKPTSPKKRGIIADIQKKLAVSKEKEQDTLLLRQEELKRAQQLRAKILGKAMKLANQKRVRTGKQVNKTKRKSGEYVKRAYHYKNPYLAENKTFEKKKLRSPDISELKRQKKNLQNRKSRIKLILEKNNFEKNKKKKLTKKEVNRLRKDILHATVAIRELNNRLGITTVVQKAPKRKIRRKREKVIVGGKEVVKDSKKDFVPVWESRDMLSEILKAGKMRYYIINGEKYKKSEQPEIFLGMAQLEDRVFASGVSTPYVLFYQRYSDKICEITEFYEETEE